MTWHTTESACALSCNDIPSACADAAQGLRTGGRGCTGVSRAASCHGGATVLGRGQPIHAGQVAEHVCRAGAGRLRGLLLLLLLLLLRLLLLLLLWRLLLLLGLLLLLLRRWAPDCASLQHLEVCLLHLQAIKTSSICAIAASMCLLVCIPIDSQAAEQETGGGDHVLSMKILSRET